MYDVMVDIETLSTEYNACIIAIGAVKFNLYNPNVERVSIELLIDTKSQNSDFHISKETIDWWFRQSQEVREHVFSSEPRLSIREAFIKLNDFCKGCSRYWANGNFDYVVLENAMKSLNKEPAEPINPVWKFWQIRDVRTIADLCKDIPKKPVNAHSPVVDCNHQIDVLHFVYNKINAKESILGKRALSFDLDKGDWECEKCKKMNFSYRANCFSCFKNFNIKL